jgi:hypothetical protein
MNVESNRRCSGSPLSTKDTLVCAPICFSALLAFALSFSLFQPNGRPYVFCGCLIVYAICLLVADKKKELFLASMLFILIRLAWSAAISGRQALHSLEGH